MRYINEEEVDKNPRDTGALSYFTVSHLPRSWEIRGVNTPEYAEYLGY
jgi:hypothetical protein